MSFAQTDTLLFLSENFNKDNLKRHIQTLASDHMEGRETAHNGQKMAADYLQKELELMGLSPQIQSYPVQEINAKNIQLTIFETSFLVEKEFEAAGTFENILINDTTVVYIKELSAKMFAKINMQNKVILLAENAIAKNTNLSLKEKVETLKGRGAIAVLVPEKQYYSSFTAWNVKRRPQKLEQDSVDFPIPVLRINGEKMDSLLMIKRTFLNRLGKKPREIELPINITSQMIDKSLTAENVMVNFASSNANDSIKNTVAIMAHYDHLGKVDDKIYYGADDNASGSAALLELARLYQLAGSLGIKTKNQVLFLWLSGEEKGLLGSRYFVEQLKKKPDNNFLVAINVDMIGRLDQKHELDSNYVYIIGNVDGNQTAVDCNASINQKYTHLNLDYSFNGGDDPNRYFYRSDHYPFAKQFGIPSIFYFSGVHDDYHQTSDTEDKIIYSKTEKISKLIFLTSWKLANYLNSPSLKENLEK